MEIANPDLWPKMPMELAVIRIPADEVEHGGRLAIVQSDGQPFIILDDHEFVALIKLSYHTLRTQCQIENFMAEWPRQALVKQATQNYSIDYYPPDDAEMEKGR